MSDNNTVTSDFVDIYKHTSNGTAVDMTGTVIGGMVPQNTVLTYPNICPGCGRCRDCGQPYPYPVQPQVPQFVPQWGQQVPSQPTVTRSAGIAANQQ